MKKIFTFLFGIFLLLAVVSCTTNDENQPITDVPDNSTDPVTPDSDPTTPTEPELPPNSYEGYTDSELINLSADGYTRNKIPNFFKYENTSAYRKVTTPEEFVSAIIDAKYHYKNVWDEATSTYTQVPADGYTEETIEGTVHVIEIMNDMNLGYYKLSDTVKSSGVVDDFCRNKTAAIQNCTMSSMFTENGMSQIKVENTSNLLIYSKNGAKLTHCGFKLTSSHNVVFRNLEMDEIWQWEDAASASVSKMGDYDAFGWAYFKISFCGSIWIDHCTFGKSYDGQIDYSNPVYDANSAVAFRAPYGADGSNGLHISWCNFKGGSDDQEGYLYQMMSEIEADYQAGNSNYLYYKSLRDAGISFEDILYGLAIPQKKGFLCGDSGDNNLDYQYNLSLQISFSNCIFTNLEDRLPKLRGGNAYMYNCIVDSSEYYTYRARLSSQNAKTVVTRVNSNWKCALVSQGIVCGNGGSMYAQNCIFRGIETLLKNNDSTSGDKLKAGYRLVDCTYQKAATDEITSTAFTNSSTGILKPDLFSWHTENNEIPFVASVVETDKLSDYLNQSSYGVGSKSSFPLDLLISTYVRS